MDEDGECRNASTVGVWEGIEGRREGGREGGRDVPKHLLAEGLLHGPPVLVVEARILLLQHRGRERGRGRKRQTDTYIHTHTERQRERWENVR